MGRVCQRQPGGNGQVAGGGSPVRNQAQKVEREDEKEKAGEIAHIGRALVPEVGNYHLVAKEEHYYLYHSAERREGPGAAPDQERQAEHQDDGGYAHHQKMF